MLTIFLGFGSLAVDIFLVPTDKLVIEVYHGVISSADMMISGQDPEFGRAAADWGENFRHMTITLKDAETIVTQEELLNLIDREQLLHPDARRVFVAEDDVVFGMSRQFVAYRQTQVPNITAVRTVPEALEFLGLTGPISGELRNVLGKFQLLD